MKRTIALWLLVGLAGFALLPWHMTDRAFTSWEWLSDGAPSTGLMLALRGGHWWLWPPLLAGLAALMAQLAVKAPVLRARLTMWSAAAGLALTALQGLIIVRAGPRLFETLLTGDVVTAGQAGFGVGAGVCLFALLFVLTVSLSQTGKGRGDAFVVSMIGLIIALVGVFVFYPVAHILVRAFEVQGGYSLTEFFPRFFSSDLWGLRCLIGPNSCGVAINSLFLATMTGAGTTLLGLSFALIFTRTDFRAKKLLRVLTIIP
ncbi:MAG: iron ABC transporter permease, partial [Albidovulum sp.]